MATHETGGGADSDDYPAAEEDNGLDTHNEDKEHESDHSGSPIPNDRKVLRDEEEKIEGHHHGKGKPEVELQDQTNLLPVRQVLLIMVGLCAALFCSLLDQTIVTTALPTLGRVFNRADITSWVGTAYLLTSTSMQPIYGRLSDIFGRKVVLLGSCAIFLIGSIACAVSNSMIQLIVFRAIQGIGGGGILTLVMIIVSDVVSLKERGKYQGVTGCIVACSNAIGPVVGGLFTEKVTWRWCFYINIPVTVFAMVVITILLPLKPVKGSVFEKLRKVDWFGSILTIAWAVLVLLGLSWAGNQYSWSSAAVLAPLILGLALLGVFIFVEMKLVPLPLIPFHIFRNRTVAAALLTTWFNGMIFFGTLYYLPNYFQVVRGDSAIRSGVLILPVVLTQTVCSFTAGMIQSRTGDYYYNLVAGFGIWTIGIGLLSSIDETTSTAKIVIFGLIDGIGAGQTFQTSLVAIQAAVQRSEMATATGCRNFVRMLGGTIGLTVCSALVNNIVRQNLNNGGFDAETIRKILNDPTQIGGIGLDAVHKSRAIAAYSDKIAKAINACFWYFIPCAGLSFFIVIFFVEQIPLKRPDDQQRKAEAKAWLEERKAKHAHKHGGTSQMDNAVTTEIDNGVKSEVDNVVMTDKKVSMDKIGRDEGLADEKKAVDEKKDVDGKMETGEKETRLEDIERELEEAAGSVGGGGGAVGPPREVV
ncbi:hypothetical protein TREMEDRAFT_26105 [Tremella mesenterica DSM 1558]|uniref:uncharacterized protein n=1 Tax=Tremella mesenterica (strain ATCC 24925 / CBS 8224 / DSM 1558 / NBRC 9311 / NRRL Y-6157 / RJB 2259-6 / UBC 559-6) TaxID=578456 RepID=UPI0003F49F0F|nr:uncharacterized protein TREMEDRAFT_26105 [Tremella mesenterica DSM 1558]EIW72421.1 hypothetical protein TREMEDRAFT_26105 [Tremella mesenterica DSM 1558]